MSKKPSKLKMGLDSGIFMSLDLFYLGKIFDLRKIFAVPKNFLKSKIYCITKNFWHENTTGYLHL